MSLRKYSLLIGLLVLISTTSLMSYAIFTLTARPFELPLLYSYLLLGFIHASIAIGFAHFKKGFGLTIYFLGYIVGFYVLLSNLAIPNEAFLHLAALLSAFVIMITGVFVGIIVELVLLLIRKKKKSEDPHLS